MRVELGNSKQAHLECEVRGILEKPSAHPRGVTGPQAWKGCSGVNQRGSQPVQEALAPSLTEAVLTPGCPGTSISWPSCSSSIC